MAITGINNHAGYINYDLGTANKQATEKQKPFKSERAVQVDISKEAMDKYRADIQKNTSVQDEETVHWSNLEDYTMQCVRIGGRDENGKPLSAEAQAQNLLDEYKSKYQQLAKGYDDGTIKIYSEDDENRVLTKDEALQKLTDSFESHARSLEEMSKQQEHAAQILEDTIRKRPEWLRSSQRAREFLKEQDEKSTQPTAGAKSVADHIINEGAVFRGKFVLS